MTIYYINGALLKLNRYALYTVLKETNGTKPSVSNKFSFHQRGLFLLMMDEIMCVNSALNNARVDYLGVRYACLVAFYTSLVSSE